MVEPAATAQDARKSGTSNPASRITHIPSPSRFKASKSYHSRIAVPVTIDLTGRPRRLGRVILEPGVRIPDDSNIWKAKDAGGLLICELQLTVCSERRVLGRIWV